MPYATIDGVRINYTEAGEGDPLLLIMGFGMPGEAWLGSLPFLGSFRAIYFDNRGTGQSDKPGGPYTIARMADNSFIVTLARDARPGNWLPTGQANRLVLVLTLLESSGSSDLIDQGRTARALPTITKVACR